MTKFEGWAGARNDASRVTGSTFRSMLVLVASAVLLLLSTTAVQAQAMCESQASGGWGGPVTGRGATPQAACDNHTSNWIVKSGIDVSVYGGYPAVSVCGGGSNCCIDWPAGQQNYAWLQSPCCLAGQQWDPAAVRCVVGPKNFGRSDCPSLQGNPVHAGWGNKVQIEQDYSGPGGLGLTRTYNSKLGVITDVNGIVPQHFGANWRSTYERRILFKDILRLTARITRQDGAVYTFTLASGAWQADQADIAFQMSDVATGFKLRNTQTDETELYDLDGRLRSITDRAGRTQTLTYSDGSTGANGGYLLDANGVPTANPLPAGRLIRVADDFGRSIHFGYDTSHVVRLIDPAGSAYGYSYDTRGNLTSVSYPTATGIVSRQYIYDEAAHSAIDQIGRAHV